MEMGRADITPHTKAYLPDHIDQMWGESDEIQRTAGHSYIHSHPGISPSDG